MSKYDNSIYKKESSVSDWINSVATIVIGALVLAIVLGIFWVLPSYYEARAFERITGKEVSTWDALWVELRVQEGTGRGEN